MVELPATDHLVELSIGDPRFASPVLERLISAAAARAGLPVDRVVDAMTTVDALVHATNSVLGEQSREIHVRIGTGSLGLRVDHLLDGQAEAIRDAASMPDVGSIFDRTATVVEIESDGVHTALVIVLD
jgi:hypothetical protein